MKKKLLALVLAAAMTLSLASCGGSKTETPSTGSDNSSAEGATYKVGICQLVQHPALDAATQGFIDALNEALPGQVEFENKNASGEADISTMPIEYTDATPKYNPTICEELGIQPLDGYEAIEG